MILLSPQLEEMSRLIGAAVIGELLMAAFSRVDTDEDKRRQFNLYCDEYQRFATSDFRSFIDEARKFKVAITLSHQSLSQLDEESRTAATGAVNMIVFRVRREDGQELAKSFDTTPSQVVIGEEPIRAPVSDVIGHLVKRGHTDARVTRFGQSYLQKVEAFMEKKYDHFPEQDGLWDVIYLSRVDIQNARELLNDCLYRCMTTQSHLLHVHPLALYMMAVARWDGSVTVLDHFMKKDWFPVPPRNYEGFKKEAERFGRPDFMDDDNIEAFMASFREKDKWLGTCMVNMVRELRYTMEVLAKEPIEVDTGQYVPKKQDRTHR